MGWIFRIRIMRVLLEIICIIAIFVRIWISIWNVKKLLLGKGWIVILIIKMKVDTKGKLWRICLSKIMYKCKIVYNIYKCKCRCKCKCKWIIIIKCHKRISRIICFIIILLNKIRILTRGWMKGHQIYRFWKIIMILIIWLENRKLWTIFNIKKICRLQISL